MIDHRIETQFALKDRKTGHVVAKYGPRVPNGWSWDPEKYILVTRRVETIVEPWCEVTDVESA